MRKGPGLVGHPGRVASGKGGRYGILRGGGKECAMTLELDQEEVLELTLALQSQHARLLGELAHADHRAFRQMLKEKCEVVERLAERIEVVSHLSDRERAAMVGQIR